MKSPMPLLTLDAENVSIEKIREHEIEEARSLQQALVPAEPLYAAPVEIAHRFRPMAGVGGDFLDYFVLSDLTLGLYLGDVVGKGLPAALYAALVVGTLRGIHKTGQAPASVLGLLNRRLRTRVLPRRYCAVQYAVFDPVSRVLCYSNAGLPGPVHVSARGSHLLELGGLPSGLLDGAGYDEQCLPMEPGDTLLFFTDGLTDARNAAGEEFGVNALLDACGQANGASATALLERVFAAVDTFVGGHMQYDDLAAAALKLG